MATEGKTKVTATRGNELLRRVLSVDPRVAEGLQREARGVASSSPQELEQLLEEEKRRAITEPYQSFLYDVRAMLKRGNFKGTQGETVLQQIRALGEKGEKTLDLSGFSVRDDFALLMVDFLRSRTCTITALNVAKTQIGIDGAMAIAKAVNGSLETLQFSDSSLDVASFRKSTQTSRRVDLSGKKYNHLDAAAIGVLIERESRKLECFDVSQNCLTGRYTNVFQGITVLLDGLKKCRRLRELNLCSVELRSEGLAALANVICDFGTLERLDLSANRVCCNSFGDRNMSGFEEFCSVLWQVKKLKVLRLAQNELDHSACTAISTVLAVNPPILKLDLSQNPFAEAGAVQLAIGVQKNVILEELDLTECNLTCVAVSALAEVLRKFNRTLRVLNFNNNRGIRSRGYKYLIHCLTVNPTIRVVHTNPLPKYEPFVARMNDLLIVNSSLVALRREFSQFSFESLSEGLRTNFIEKLQELSEQELLRLYDMQVVADAEIGLVEGLNPAISSLRYYSEMQQYAPLKRLLWILERGSREEEMSKRPKRSRAMSPSRGGDSGDDDIWDYPIA